MKKFLEHCCVRDRFSGCMKGCEDSCLRSLNWLFYLIIFLIKINFKCWSRGKNLKNYWILEGHFWCPFPGMRVSDSEKALSCLSDWKSFFDLNTYPNGVALIDSLSIWIIYYMANFHADLKWEEMPNVSHSRHARMRALKSMYPILKSLSV